MRRLLFHLLVAAMLVFLLAPVLLVVPMSFSADRVLAWPPSGFSIRWYQQMLNETALIQSARNSLLLACGVTLATLAMAMPAALALDRWRFAGRDAVLALLTAPLLLPTIVLALALLIVFVSAGLLGTWTGLVLGHMLVTLPYAVRVLATSLSTLPIAVEEAAATLGASPLVVFRRITLPMMKSGLIGTTALCALVSFDEVVLSLFMTGPRISTLPVAMFHHVEQQADPLVASLSVLLVLLTLVVVLIVDRTSGLAKTFMK